MADSPQNELQEILGSNDKSRPKLTRTGLMILGVSGAVFGGIYAVTAPFLTPALRRICLPYVPATTTQVRNVLTALKLVKDHTGPLIDIGSGDGRIVLEAAKMGFRSYGVELNPWLILYSRISAKRAGLGQNAMFFRQDLWKTDLSKYNNVVVFGVESMMEPLGEKLSVELPEGGYVVACRFPLPNCTPAQTIGSGVDTVWLYRHKVSLENT